MEVEEEIGDVKPTTKPFLVKLICRGNPQTKGSIWWTVLYKNREISLEEAEGLGLIKFVDSFYVPMRKRTYKIYEVHTLMVFFVRYIWSNTGRIICHYIHPNSIRVRKYDLG